MLPHTWPHAILHEDIRTPLFTTAQQYDILFLSMWNWLEIAAICILEATLGGLFGAILYAFVVQPRKLRRLSQATATTTTKQQQQSKPTHHPMPTVSDCLWVFGIVVPFWIFAPNPVMNALGIHNQIIRFCVGTITPTLSMFRATQALFGFDPLSQNNSTMGAFAFQYGSPLLIQTDPTTGQWKRATWSSTGRKFLHSRSMLFVTGLFHSCFYCFDFFPAFHIPRPQGYYTIQHVTLEQCKDNFLFGILVMLYLTTFCEGLAFLTMLLTGYETQPVMRNPIFASSCPSDFWGRRWNRLIHDCLKQGVYKPIRAMGGSHVLGVLGAFVASGTFHEWLLVTAFPTVVPVHGPTLFFFTWQVGLIVLEQVLVPPKTLVRLQTALPRPVLSLLVVLLALPIAHLFLDAYIHSAFFDHGSLLIPVIRPVGHGLAYARP